MKRFLLALSALLCLASPTLALTPAQRTILIGSDALETSRNSGIWFSTGVANAVTFDGVHETAAGNGRITSSGVVQTVRIHR